MIFFSKIISVIGILNMVICSGFTIYFYIKPEDFAFGTTINSLVFIIGFFAFYIMMILMAIYYCALKSKWENLISFNKYNIPLYIIFLINFIKRCFFDKGLNVLGSSTPSKNAATLASALLLNLTFVTVTINYIKQQ